MLRVAVLRASLRRRLMDYHCAVRPQPHRSHAHEQLLMCDSPAYPREVATAVPRPAAGPAVDPIALEPVDEIVITTLVDNVYDALLTGDERTTRALFAADLPRAPQFEAASTTVGLMAEHGFSALVSVRRGTSTTTLLFDTGLSPDAMVTNAAWLGADLSRIQAVVLSDGHFDHGGGLAGLAGRQGTRSLPMVVHPMIWTRRRLAVPGREPDELPTLSKRALEGEGLAVIERREPSLLADGCVLIIGEVDRTTEFERGMPAANQQRTGSAWQHDSMVIDDQALVAHLRGRGLPTRPVRHRPHLDAQHPAAAGAPCRPAQSVHPARATGRRKEGRPPHRRGIRRGAGCHYRLTLTIAGA
jgi:7,8-dihydropterin-6-yl-methyl-4-(beta-D-ribofuranosyl)aminobenzene 5'-phosphate synthase